MTPTQFSSTTPAVPPLLPRSCGSLPHHGSPGRAAGRYLPCGFWTSPLRLPRTPLFSLHPAHRHTAHARGSLHICLLRTRHRTLHHHTARLPARGATFCRTRGTRATCACHTARFRFTHTTYCRTATVWFTPLNDGTHALDAPFLRAARYAWSAHAAACSCYRSASCLLPHARTAAVFRLRAF